MIVIEIHFSYIDKAAFLLASLRYCFAIMVTSSVKFTQQVLRPVGAQGFLEWFLWLQVSVYRCFFIVLVWFGWLSITRSMHLFILMSSWSSKHSIVENYFFKETWQKCYKNHCCKDLDGNQTAYKNNLKLHKIQDETPFASLDSCIWLVVPRAY